MSIQKALAALNPDTDEHWTREGLPVVGVVQELAGEKVKVDRQAITELAPNFTRETWRDQKAAVAAETGKVTADDQGANLEEPDQFVANHQGDDQVVDQLVAHHQDDAQDAGMQVDDDPVMAQVVELDAQAADKIDAIRQTEADIKAGQAELAQLVREHDQIKFERQRLLPNSTNTEATRAYILNQNKIRAERVARRNAALEGLSPSDLRKGSPLDEAHQRRRQRGTKRPGRLPMQHAG